MTDPSAFRAEIKVSTQAELDTALARTDRGRRQPVAIIDGCGLRVKDARVLVRGRSCVVAHDQSHVDRAGVSEMWSARQ